MDRGGITCIWQILVYHVILSPTIQLCLIMVLILCLSVRQGSREIQEQDKADGEGTDRTDINKILVAVRAHHYQPFAPCFKTVHNCRVFFAVVVTNTSKYRNNSCMLKT